MPPSALAALFVTLVIGLGGCGSGSGSDPGVGSGSSSTGTSSHSSITGFGAVAGGHEKAAVAAAVHSFLTALANHDYPGLCGRITASNRKQLRSFGEGGSGAGGCATVLRKLLNPGVAGEARRAAAAPVKSVRIEGETAFALFTPKGGSASYLVMRAEGGGWKAISLTPGTPLDPTATANP
ncbi:MAG: hypothetical protein JSU06_01335 [Actinobacteria bacterium]|nr:hypothetical protein [Actinomycetota bacterium]